VLSRSPERAAEKLGVEATGWDPAAGPAPSEVLGGADAIIHLAGESVAQRWNEESKHRIRESREIGTRNLVAGLTAAPQGNRPSVLVSASATGYYGPRGDEVVEDTAPAGTDFLAGVCVAWEREAAAAEALGLRVCSLRTGLLLDADGGGLAKMLPAFRLGVGGPVAGGKQWVPWIHADDVAGLYMRAIDDTTWSGPFNATAPAPVTNARFSRALGRELHRPAITPVPALALRLLYGEMADLITTGQRAVPSRALAAGFDFRYAELDQALRAALS
jgi:hypothetical protein